MTSRRGAVAMAVLMAAAFALRAWVAAHAGIIEHDGAMYAWLAAALLRGDLAGGLSTVWPPLDPVLIAIAAWPAARLGLTVTPELLEGCARLVSIVTGTLLLVPLHRVARRLAGERIAWGAAALAAFHPRLIQYSASALTEMPFALLVVAGVALLVESPVGWGALAAGAAFGLAYLARPEGLPLAVVAWIACAMGSSGTGARGLGRSTAVPAAGPAAGAGRIRRQAIGLGFATFVVGFVLAALPYLSYLRAELGHPSLGEKGSYNLWREYKRDYAQIFGEPEGLSERGFESPELARATPVPRVHALAFVLRRPGLIARRTLEQLGTLVVSSLPGACYWPYFAFALVGIGLLRRPDALPLGALLVATPLLYSPFTTDRRFLVPAIPWVLVLAANGAGSIGSWLGRSARARETLAALGLTALCIFGGVYSLIHPLMESAPEHKAAGIWLRAAWPTIGRSRDAAEIEPGVEPERRPIVMSRKPWVAFYGGGLVAELPEGGLDSVLARARRKHADLLVVDARWAVPNRPALEPLLDPANAPPGLVPLYRADEPRRLVVYDLRRLEP